METTLQKQYDLIYRFFKNTTEPFDDLDWDGELLNVFFENKIVETYSYKDMCDLIEGLSDI
jgi:hypothetical protein